MITTVSIEEKERLIKEVVDQADFKKDLDSYGMAMNKFDRMFDSLKAGTSKYGVDINDLKILFVNRLCDQMMEVVEEKKAANKGSGYTSKAAAYFFRYIGTRPVNQYLKHIFGNPDEYKSLYQVIDYMFQQEFKPDQFYYPEIYNDHPFSKVALVLYYQIDTRQINKGQYPSIIKAVIAYLTFIGTDTNLFFADKIVSDFKENNKINGILIEKLTGAKQYKPLALAFSVIDELASKKMNKKK